MLRRGHNKSSIRLSRSKSTASICMKQDNIDPEVARRDAYAAAKYAFARAQDRDSADMDRSQGLLKNNSTYSQRTRGHQGVLQKGNGQVDPSLRRKQSVRFAGPDAVQCGRSLATRAFQYTTNAVPSQASQRPRALTTNDPVPAAFRPPSRSSSIGKAAISDGAENNFLAALTAYDEYYTREDDIASTPSSYRHVRRSKSLLGVLKRPPSVLFNNGTPESDYKNNLRQLLPQVSSSPDQAILRAPKSMSFLRGGRDHKTYRVRHDHDAAIQEARDKYLHHIGQQRLREQPSFIFRAKTRQLEKPFRQPLRNSSVNSYGMPIASSNQATVVSSSEEGSLRKKARNASKNLKNKLKSLFRRSGSDSDEPLLPEQQVESQKSHGASFIASATTSHGSYADVQHSGRATVSRVSSRVPSLHAIPSNQQLCSRTGSLQSLRSETSEKSRVTSWTSTLNPINSDNSAPTGPTQAERDRQRLSIIQENGTHVSSASFRRPPLPNQTALQSSFPGSRGLASQLPPVSIRCAGPVDPQNLFNILMDRLEENIPQAKQVTQQMPSVGTCVPPSPIPPRSSSVGSHREVCRSHISPTIRQVIDESNMIVPASHIQQANLTSWPRSHDDVFSPNPSATSTESSAHHRSNSNASVKTMVRTIPRKNSYVACPTAESGDSPLTTPQLIANRNEPLLRNRGLRESRSTFFGASAFTINRTTSPYRRALAEVDYNPAVVTGDSPLEPTVRKVSPVISSKTRAVSMSRGTPDIAYSESVYSRTTSGQTPPNTQDRPSDPLVLQTLPSIITGSAVVVHRATYRPTLPTHCSQQNPSDLRLWMAEQVATLEKKKENDETTHVNYALPRMPKAFTQHVREQTQISHDDSEVVQRKENRLQHPLGDHPHNVQQPFLKPILKNKSTTSLTELFKPPPPPPLPPILQRSPLRTSQSHNSMLSVNTTNNDKITRSASSTNNLTKKENWHVQRPCTVNTNCSTKTPAKLVKGHSQAAVYTPSSDLKVTVSKHVRSAGSVIRHSERHVGSAGSRTLYSTPTSRMETQTPIKNGTLKDQRYDSKELETPVSQLDAQIVGSRRMVDNFLSSRRRRIVGSDESNVFL